MRTFIIMQVTVEIEDKHYDEFAELVKTLDYATLSGQYVIPEWQQNLVRERCEKMDRGEMKFIQVDDDLSQLFDDE